MFHAAALMVSVLVFQDAPKKNLGNRTYRIHVPASYKQGTPVPLIFDLHGGRSNCTEHLRGSGLVSLADKEGFIIVLPEAVGGVWADGQLLEKGADDVGFIRDLLDAVSKEYTIDSKRVYATGISNGGFMTQRLGVELSDRFAAIAPVAATMGEKMAQSFRPKNPIPVLLMNGAADPIIPYNGGTLKLGMKIVSTDEVIRKWVAFNGCSASPETQELPDVDAKDGTRVKRLTWRNSKTGAVVVLYRIEGGGHTYPGGAQYLPERTIGKVCRDINSAQVIWEFFKAHSKP